MTLEQVQDVLEGVYWRYAKTMSYIPHHYTLRQTWKDESKFEDVVRLIREYGTKENFGKKTFTYLYAGKFKYWTMGSPIDRTKLINKVQI